MQRVYKFCILFYVLCACSIAWAQKKQQNIWYFGVKAGLDFNGGAVVSRNDGQVDGDEGTAGICDSSGALLFYTNGMKVMNRKHVQMMNGDNIWSHTSSTQSSIIIPKPGSQRFFYLLTVDACTWVKAGDGAFRYSLVDMCGDRGYGKVVAEEKNVFRLDSVTEKLAAVRHQNGVDYWIIVHKHASNAFYSYLLSAAGLSSSPVISLIGSVHKCSFNDPPLRYPPVNCPGGVATGGPSSAGQMKASPDGNRIALVTTNNRYIYRELFNFDRTTGMLSNFISLNPFLDSIGFNYGTSFSPNSKKLYMTKDGNGVPTPYISQYDLEAGGGNPDSIRASEIKLWNSPIAHYNNRGMQLGPDGKIYISHQQNELGVIHNPDQKGTACNYVEKGFITSLTRFGLPSVVDAYDYSNTMVPSARTSLRDTFMCNGNPLVLKDTLPDRTYLWNTGATLSFITVNTPGIYWVDVTGNEGCTNRDTIQVSPRMLPASVLPKDTSFCGPDSIVLDAGYLSLGTYLWNTGHNGRTFTSRTPAKYWVTLTSPFTCPATDTVNVQQVLKPHVELGPDTALCKIEGYILNAYSPGATYLWNTGSTVPSLPVLFPGKYEVQVTYKSCAVKDSVIVTRSPVPLVNLGSDRKICSEDSITLDAGNTGSIFLWNDLSSAKTKKIKAPGIFYVSVTNSQGCQATDTLVLDTITSPIVSLGPDTALCKMDGFILNAFSPGATYLWNTGSTASFLPVVVPGKYEVQVTYKSCTVKDSVLVQQKPVPVVNLGSDLKICSEDSITLDAGNTGSKFLWNDLSSAQIKTVNAPGVFYVSVTNSQGCLAMDTLVLDTFTSPVVSLGPDSAACEDVPFVLDAGAGFDKYTWADGTGKRTLAVTATGTYVVTVEDQHTCKASDTVQVILHSLPSVELSRQLLLCKPDTIIRPVGNFAGYLWQDSSTAPYLHITGYGVYSVKVTGEHNCSNTATIKVVNSCPPDIFVPNAFTPNQDGNNDLYFPVVVNVKSISWKIYNRWGQLLFETDDLKKGWDGLFENEAATPDVYVYVINYVGTNDQSGTKRGNVTLIR